MRRMTFLRLVIIGLMICSVFLSIASKLTENRPHEMIDMFIVIQILINVLNWRWYGSVWKAKYDMCRILNGSIQDERRKQ